MAIASAQMLQVENYGIGSIEELNNGFHFAFTATAIVAAVAAIMEFVEIKKSNAVGGVATVTQSVSQTASQTNNANVNINVGG